MDDTAMDDTAMDDARDETAELFRDHGLTFDDEPDAGTRLLEPVDDDDIAEFQPRQRSRLHWLTVLLIALIIWGAGFLVGVLVDRAIAGALG